MTCATSRFGLFCHKKIKRDPLLRNPVIDKSKGRHHLSFLMCGNRQKSTTFTCKKWAFRDDQRVPAIVHGARHSNESRISRNAIKDDRNAINKSSNRDDTLSSNLVHEARKLKADIELIPTEGSRFHSNSSRWICKESVSSVPGTQTYRPQSLANSQDICRSMVVHSADFCSDKKRVRTDEGFTISDQKRRKLDIQKQTESMDVDSGIESSSSRDGDVSGALDVIQDHEYTRNTCTSDRKQSSPIHPTSSPLSNSENIQSKVGSRKSQIWEPEKTFRKDRAYCWFQTHGVRQLIECLHEVVLELLIKSIASKKSWITIYTPQHHVAAPSIKDLSPLQCRTGNGYFLEGTPNLASLRYHKEMVTRSYLRTNASLRRPLETKSILRTLCGAEAIRSEEFESPNLFGLNCPFEHHITESCQSFMLVMDKQLRVMFVSKNVWRHLGYQQNDMLGRSIGHFVHPNNLLELSKLTSRGQFQPAGNDNRSPIWMTRKMLDVLMKLCRRTLESGTQDTDYIQVHWDVRIQLIQTGQSLVAICRPARLDSVLGTSLDGNMLINDQDLSSRYNLYNSSHEKTKQRLCQKNKDFEDVNSANSCLPTDLPLPDCEETNNLIIDSWKNTEEQNRELSLEQLFSSSSFNVLVNSFSTSKEHGNETKFSSKNTDSSLSKFSTTVVPESSKEHFPKPEINTLVECNLSFTNQLMVNLGEAHNGVLDNGLNEAGSNYPDISSELIVKMSEKNSANQSTIYINSNQQPHSLSLLSSCHNDTICESVDSATEKRCGASVERREYNPQSRKSLKTKSILKFSQSISNSSGCTMCSDHNQPDNTDISILDFTDNKRSDFSDDNEDKSELSILNENYSSSNQPSVEYACQKEVNSHIINQHNSDNGSNTFSNTLSSILQMGTSTPPLSPKDKKNNNFLNTDIIASESDSICKSSMQNSDREHSSFVNESTLFTKKSPTVKVPQSSSSNFSHKNSPILSTLFSTVFNLSPATNRTSPLSSVSSENYLSTNNNQLENLKQDNKNISSLAESITAQSPYASKMHVLSKMTNKNCDPFLSEASFSEVNNLYGTDFFDEMAPVKCSVISPLLTSGTPQHVPTIDPEKLPNLADHAPRNISQTFMDSSESMTQVSFASEGLNELDSFLNTIPESPCLTTPTNTAKISAISFSEWSKPDTSTNQGLESGSNDLFDSEITSKPSLLRTLLDKEGVAVQGPQTYMEWILEQIPKKKNDMKKERMLHEAPGARHILSKQTKSRKNMLKKTRELPKISLSRGHVKFNNYSLQDQKPTKELPLPSSIKAAVMSSAQQNIIGCEFVHENDTSERTGFSPSETAVDFSLPDDLLDMAMEYCAPLDLGQAEALISDLNGSCSWEDNLYSLLETSSQEKSVSASCCQSTQQQAGQPVSSPVIVMSYEPTCNLSIPKENLDTPSVPCSSSDTPSFQDNKKYVEEHMDNILGHPQLQFSQKVRDSENLPKSHELITTCECNLKHPATKVLDSTNINRKMSFLRAAITSPDVDKLIEQIPFANATKHICSSQMTSCKEGDDPDIVITKVIGLQKSQSLMSVHVPHGRINKISSPNSTKLPDNVSGSKYVISSNNSTTAADHKDTVSLGHNCVTRLPIKHIDTWQLSRNVPTSTDPVNSTEVPPRTNPVVIKISLGSNSAKIISVNSGSQNNIPQRLKQSSKHSFCGQLNSRFSKMTAITNTDLSSTHPVSVMIMRKENHKSRRSKNIAIQTDNLPGEIYPEFEHNPSDTILYPSVVISYPPVVSPRQDMSPLSTSMSSQSSMSELEKFLRCNSSSDDSSLSADDDYNLRPSSSPTDENFQLTPSSSSIEEDSQLGSSNSFLLKLLTGELSKDCYQRLDQQLLEKERKKSIAL